MILCPDSADSGGFLLPGALDVLRRKPIPGAEVLGGREQGHIHSNFRGDANGGKGLNTWHRHNKIELWKIHSGDGKNKRFQIGFTEFETIM